MSLPQSLRIRSITAVLFGIFTIGLIVASSWSYILFLAIVAFCCSYEWVLMIWKEQNPIFRIVFASILALAVFATTNFGIITLIYVGLGLLTLLLIFVIWQFLLIKDIFFIFSGGLLYLIIPLSLAYFVGLDRGEYNYKAVLYPLFLIWANDVFAFLIGSVLGRTKMIPQVSPNKTWEGTIGGIVICCLLSIWLGKLFFENGILLSALFGIGVGIISTLGDLFESALKRVFQIKDSGTWLPGHGGFLDRFDSFLFVMPYTWLFWNIIKLS